MKRGIKVKGIELNGTEITSTGAELNILDGVLATADEINRACDVSTRIVNCAAATLALSVASHDGKIVTLNKADGQAITVPDATGSGAKFTLIVGTSITSVGTTITLTGNTFIGTAILDNGATVDAYNAGASDEILTMDGSTTGGIKGAIVELVDIAADVWFVRYVSPSSGTEATPFSSAA